MHVWDTVAIVGVGLIGGSIGLGLRSRGLAQEVVGIGWREASLRQAKRMGAVTRTTLDMARGVAKADLVVVCTPVEQVVPTIRQADAACRHGTVITDAGSTKSDIVTDLADLRNARFVGGHPLAGSEKRGPQAAMADLFEGRVTVVTPTRDTDADALAAVERLWSGLGSRVVRMTHQAHDAALADTSHLPHVAASALALATPRELLPLVAGGWSDTPRVAAGEGALWRQILLSNRRNVARALSRYEKTVARFRRALADDDAAALEALLMEAKRIRDAVGS